MKNKIALITGINGQDGSYLAEFLLKKNYSVHGLIRRNSNLDNHLFNIEGIVDKITLHYGDMTDTSSLMKIVSEVMPDEIYNLAAQSHVRVSFDQPAYTLTVNGVSVLNLIETVKLIKPDAKIYQASTSEMFGNNVDTDGYQRETTNMSPVSPYGASKVLAYNICKNYRNSYNMFISNGILFNHESPRRGIDFVTNKVCLGAVKIKLGLETNLKLGNLDATRDWGHAKDYVTAMWTILQQDKPDDFVCSSGISKSIKDLCEYVFNKLGLNYLDYVKIDDNLKRPEELIGLKGDCSKLKNLTGWSHEYTFETMLDEMVDYWLQYFEKNNKELINDDLI